MKCEIDKNYYCAVDSFSNGYCHADEDPFYRHICNKEKCRYYRCKHPNPEQFLSEYGEEVPDDMPVWVLSDYDSSTLKGNLWSIGNTNY